MFMSRMKLVVCALVIVVITFFSTAALFFSTFPGGPYGALRLWIGMQTVSSQYYEDIDANSLIDGALQGMVKALGDPYSAYMDEESFAQFNAQTSGSFGGVGIVLGSKNDTLTVVSPIEGTPGERAGVKTGDIIRKIDGTDAQNMTTEDAVGIIRGPEGTPVILTLERTDKSTGEVTEFDVTLVREIIKIQSVYGKMLEGDVGYIRLTSFSDTTAKDFLIKLDELDKQGMKRLVLDLRNNPGGYLHSAIQITGILLKEGEVVSTIGRDGVKEISRAGGVADRYGSLVVIINEGSASASEIVAGAVQDRHGGTLVGMKSFGKGSVQGAFPLDKDMKTAIRLTIAKYYTPSGRSIHGVGLEPDVVVDWSGEGPPFEVGTDPQLMKALEVLQGK